MIDEVSDERFSAEREGRGSVERVDDEDLVSALFYHMRAEGGSINEGSDAFGDHHRGGEIRGERVSVLSLHLYEDRGERDPCVLVRVDEDVRDSRFLFECFLEVVPSVLDGEHKLEPSCFERSVEAFVSLLGACDRGEIEMLTDLSGACEFFIHGFSSPLSKCTSCTLCARVQLVHLLTTEGKLNGS